MTILSKVLFEAILFEPTAPKAAASIILYCNRDASTVTMVSNDTTTSGRMVNLKRPRATAWGYHGKSLMIYTYIDIYIYIHTYIYVTYIFQLFLLTPAEFKRSGFVWFPIIYIYIIHYIYDIYYILYIYMLH